eukprot:TRINITY_DN8071_c0_g1_i4.p1 TRINITY_DN8071_c0_g1~~TRINITY_DN8071_c0_g1_i4.p1  ORF type:complete len:489 (+),score=29.34 TRINITY_DN8071_c0_g1_i4:102-1568(+)
MGSHVIEVLVAMLALGMTCSSPIGPMCQSSMGDTGCNVDGTGCKGAKVEFMYYAMNVSTWSPQSKTSTIVGEIDSWGVVGKADDWQMYLHGPILRPMERDAADVHAIPPVITHATWTNKIYRFDQFSQPESGKNLTAAMKLIGYADAPSTSFPIEDPTTGHLTGLLVGEGQPFLMSVRDYTHMEVGQGGVSVLLNGTTETCTRIFPDNHKTMGQVVNTVNCHPRLGICFFTVWKFFDDSGVWPFIGKLSPDCLYYCMAVDLGTNPRCLKSAVVVDENGEKICHKDGVGAVHGMTIGLDNPSDDSQFDIFLVFTGKATFIDGESSMKKVKVQAVFDPETAQRDIKVVQSLPYATQLFVDFPPINMDVGGDHAWVDDTGKWIWVSTFRTGGPGIHMLDYSTGQIMYSVTGLTHMIPDQYLYSAGIHGTGTYGKKGSYIAVASSACHDVAMCAPMPWMFPIPRSYWAKGVQFIIDIGSLSLPFMASEVTVV